MRKGASFIGKSAISLISQITGNVSIGVGAISLLFVLGIIVFKMATTEEQEKNVSLETECPVNVVAMVCVLIKIFRAVLQFQVFCEPSVRRSSQ